MWEGDKVKKTPSNVEGAAEYEQLFLLTATQFSF